MVFNRLRSTNLPPLLLSTIHRVTSLKILGVTLTHNLKWPSILTIWSHSRSTLCSKNGQRISRFSELTCLDHSTFNWSVKSLLFPGFFMPPLPGVNGLQPHTTVAEYKPIYIRNCIRSWNLSLNDPHFLISI